MEKQHDAWPWHILVAKRSNIQRVLPKRQKIRQRVAEIIRRNSDQRQVDWWQVARDERGDSKWRGDDGALARGGGADPMIYKYVVFSDNIN